MDIGHLSKSYHQLRVPYLRERHFGDDGEHDLLALGRVRVLLVLVEPRLQRRRRLARRVLPPRRKVVAAAVSAENEALDAGISHRGYFGNGTALFVSSHPLAARLNGANKFLSRPRLAKPSADRPTELTFVRPFNIVD